MAMRIFSELEMDVLVLPKRLGADIIGIFLVVDDASGFWWLEGIRDQSAETLAGALYSRVLRNFPTPLIMRSDGHASFDSSVMKSLLDEYGIEQRISAPYNPREHGGVERANSTVWNRLRAVYNGPETVKLSKVLDRIEYAGRDSPSEAHAGLSPNRIVFNTHGSPPERGLPWVEPLGLAEELEARTRAMEALQRAHLAMRIDRQYRRDRDCGSTGQFKVGDTVAVLRPPSDKLTQGAVAPFLVVGADESGAYYSTALMGPEGDPVGMATRVAAGQLRAFNMARTTPAAEWQRLQQQEFGTEYYTTRAVTSHRPSRRGSAASEDLEFEVVWITNEGDVSTWEPVRYLSRNVDFKEYVAGARLAARVRRQLAREMRMHHDQPDV
jgi:hypothetical protein